MSKEKLTPKINPSITKKETNIKPSIKENKEQRSMPKYENPPPPPPKKKG